MEKQDKLTSKIFNSASNLQIGSIGNFGSQVSIGPQNLVNLNKALKKINKNDLNIILCLNSHPQIMKFRKFAKAMRDKNWQLLQIDPTDKKFFQSINNILEAQLERNQKIQQQQFNKILNSKTLYLLVHYQDYGTIDIFNQQQNIYCNMSLNTYQDADDFAVKLRDGVKSSLDFTIAVVPGISQTVNTQYSKVITQFNHQYKNLDAVQNYRFIINFQGRFQSKIKSNLLSISNIETQSLIKQNSQNWLRNILKSRDQHFHPLNGLKGSNVYILYRRSKPQLVQGIRDYIGNNARLHMADYIDRVYLRDKLKTLTIKDSVIVLTDDDSLRQAQEIVKDFNQVYIMNITDRTNTKDQKKVMTMGSKQIIYGLLKDIPDANYILEDQQYQQTGRKDISLRRDNRMLPKNFILRKGDTIAIRMPGHLDTIQSRKFEIRLKKYFKDQIKIQYYRDPKDIRLTNKLQQPLTFIICTVKQLEYMKGIAQIQKNQLRQQFILYNQNPLQFTQLRQNDKYQRFRLASNRWEEIQQYIIGTDALIRHRQVKISINANQRIHVFMQSTEENKLMIFQQIIKYGTKASERCLFYSNNENIIKKILGSYYYKDKYYLVINQNNGSMNRQKGIGILKKYSYLNKDFSLIVINSDTKTHTLQKTQDIRTYQQNSKNVAKWLSQITVNSVNYNFHSPTIIIDYNNIDWYYFLEKQTRILTILQKQKKFDYKLIENKDYVKDKILEIRQKDKQKNIWIIVKNIKQMKNYKIITDKIENNRKIRYIIHGPDQISNNDSNSMIFAHPDRKQIQAFILNAFRRSQKYYFPSWLKIKVLYWQYKKSLKCLQIRNKFKNGKLNLKLKLFILQILKNQIKLKLIILNIQSMSFMMLIQKIQCLETPLNLSNFKRIIINQQHNVLNLKSNYEQNQNKLYVGTYPVEISQFLRNLRYNIKNPQEQLEKQLKKQILWILIQDNIKIYPQTIKKLQLMNDSVIHIQQYQKGQIKKQLEQINNDYNIIIIGKDSVDQEVIKYNKQNKNNKNLKYIIYKQQQPINKRLQNSQNINYIYQKDQLLTYLFHLPENRYNKAKNYKKNLNILYDINDPKLEIPIKYLKDVIDRNKNIKLNSFKTIQQLKQYLNKNNKQQTIVIINQEDQGIYRKIVGNKDNLYYFIRGNDSNKKLVPYQDVFFITRDPIIEYKGFLNNLPSLEYTNKLKRPTINPSKVQNFDNVSQTIDIHKYLQIIVKPLPQVEEFHDYKDKTKQNFANPIQLPKDIFSKISKKDYLFDGPYSVPDKPSYPIKITDITNRTKRPLNPPTLDSIPLLSSSFTNGTKPDSTISIRPIPNIQPRKMIQKLAILYQQKHELEQIGKCLKSNLQPLQYHITLFPYKNDYELEQYSKNNCQKLDNYDKIVIFLQRQMFDKYQQNLSSMKKKMGYNRFEYFLFDDNFHIRYSNLVNFLKPYQIKQQKLPYQNPYIPTFLNRAKIFNILVPRESQNKYKSDPILNKQNIIGYHQQSDVYQWLPRKNQYTIIVCKQRQYQQYIKFVKMSPRTMLFVQGDSITEDQLLLFRYPLYSLYFGKNPIDYLVKLTQNRRNPGYENQILNVLFYNPNNAQQQNIALSQIYIEYQKVPYKSWKDLYKLLRLRYSQSNNWLLKNKDRRWQITRLIPKVYLQSNETYQQEYKNDYLNRGYLHDPYWEKDKKIPTNNVDFANLIEVHYYDHKDLQKKLENQDAPSIIIINQNNKKLMILGSKIRSQQKHIVKQVINIKQRWIQANGNLPVVTEPKLQRKQFLLTQIFNHELFDTYNDMKFYYLSNRASHDGQRNILYRPKQQLVVQYHQNPNLLMVVFVQDGDIKHFPSQFYTQVQNPIGRVKLIKIKTDFVDSQTQLYVKYNQIDPVIYHINNIQFSGRINFILFMEGQGQRQMQRYVYNHKLDQIENRIYYSIDDIHKIAKEIKGKYKKVYIICFKDQQQEINKILSKYSIKNKGIKNQGVQFIIIQKSTIPIPTPSQIINKSINKSINISYQDQVIRSTSILPLDSIISNQNFSLAIHQNMKDNMPVGKFYAREIIHFSNQSQLQNKKNYDSPQLIISNDRYKQLHKLANSSPHTLLIYVDDAMKSGQIGHTLIIHQKDLPNLIRKLQGQNQNNISQIKHYKDIKIIYGNNVSRKSKIRLIQLCKNKNVSPIHYNGDLRKIKRQIQNNQSLLCSVYDQQPIQIKRQLQEQNYEIIPKNNIKLFLKKPNNRKFGDLSIIIEQMDQQISQIPNLTDNQLTFCLEYIQKNPNNRQKIIAQLDTLIEAQIQQINQPNSKLDVNSNLDNQYIFYQNQKNKIKQLLNGNIVVLFIQKSKRQQYKPYLQNFNIIVQSYINIINLKIQLQQKKQLYVNIVIFSRRMLDDLFDLKNNYPNTIFILENQNGIEVPQRYRPLINGQIRKYFDISKMLKQLLQQNQKNKNNSDHNNKINSRVLDPRKPSIIDSIIHSRNSLVISTNKSKKINLFYKDPNNNHIKNKLSQIFINVGFIPYKNIQQLKNIINSLKLHYSIVIVNDKDTLEIQNFLSKQKSLFEIIRFNSPQILRDSEIPRKIYHTKSKIDLQNFVEKQLKRNFGGFTQRSLDSKYVIRYAQKKNYKEHYRETTFGTAQRFQNDYIPTNRQNSHSKDIIRSASKIIRSQKYTQQQVITPKHNKYPDYYVR